MCEEERMIACQDSPDQPLRPACVRKVPESMLNRSEQGSAGGDTSGLSWTVACAVAQGQAPPPQPLLASPPLAVAAAAKRQTITFSVPTSGCDAQWLKLIGVDRIAIELLMSNIPTRIEVGTTRFQELSTRNVMMLP